MTTDFRALCVELTDCLEKADWPLRHRYVFRQWIDIARAALADEPAVPEGREPASVVAEPSDEEVAGLVADLQQQANHGFSEFISRNDLLRAAELLQRLIPPQPVPVSERPPGPEDCAPWPQPSDNSGWCWMSRTVHGFYGSFAIWEQVSVVPTCREVYTHWLPAHALPLPEVNNG